VIEFRVERSALRGACYDHMGAIDVNQLSIHEVLIMALCQLY